MLHSTHIVALIKEGHIKSRCFSGPKAKNGNSLSVFTRNIHIIRNRLYGFVILNVYMVETAVPRFVYVALKTNLKRALFVGDKPNFAARKPKVRKLGLPAVNKLLLENSAFIKYGISSCGVSVGCERVKRAGGKSAEAAVAETCVRFALIKIFKLNSVVGENTRENVCEI